MAEKWEEKEHHHEEVVKKAVEETDRIILDGSDGSVEQTEPEIEKALTPEEKKLKALYYQS